MLGLNRAVIDSAGQTMKMASVLPETLVELGKRQAGNVPDLVKTQFVKLFRGARAHSPQALDQKVSEELLFVPGRDLHQAVGFLQVGCDLGEKLVGCDSDGCTESLLFSNAPSYLESELPTLPEQRNASGHIEKSFVNRDLFHEISKSPENLHNSTGNLPVLAHIASQVNSLRAPSVGATNGHRGM